MQGLPTQLLSKSAKARSLGDKVSVKTEAGVDAPGSDNNFGSLLEGLTGKKNNEKITSEVSSLKGEALKNLATTNAEGDVEIAVEQLNTNPKTTAGEVEFVVDSKDAEALLAALATKSTMPVVDSKNTEALLAALAARPAAPQLNANANTTEREALGNIEQKITKAGSNLDKLLNSLKGTQDNTEVLEENGNEPLQNIRAKKGERLLDDDLKAENPLDFLMTGAKTKDVSVKTESSESSDLESILGQKKMMTGEDYLKNMESSEKKVPGKLALVNGLELPKNPNQNVKAYGQGLTLLSDPLIRNTKDLAFKDGNKGKNASIDEVGSKDMRVGAELSGIKQDVIPMMQNKENNGQQTEKQTQGSEKVLDLGKINTANTNEIIKRISDYVEQNQVANKSSLDLTVKHDSLGEFKIQVSKMPGQSTVPGQNMIDMQITTSSKEGHDFFMKNEIGLMKNLNNAGINLSDLRIVSSMSDATSSGQTDSRQSNSNQNPDSNGKQFNSPGSFSSEFSNGKERRKELWEEYQQRYGA